MPKGFFDNHPPPAVAVLFHQSGGREFGYDRPKITGSVRKIVEEILMARVLLIYLGKKVLELRIQFVVVEISGEVIETACEPLPEIVICAFPTVRFDVVMHPFSKLVVRHLGAR